MISDALCWHLEHDVSLEEFERWARRPADEDVDREFEVAREIRALEKRRSEDAEWRKRKIEAWRKKRERMRKFWKAVSWIAGIAGAIGIAICILHLT